MRQTNLSCFRRRRCTAAAGNTTKATRGIRRSASAKPKAQRVVGEGFQLRDIRRTCETRWRAWAYPRTCGRKSSRTDSAVFKPATTTTRLHARESDGAARLGKVSRYRAHG